MHEVVTIETPGLGDRSYLIHDGRLAVVIDPQRDIGRMLQAAGARISHVLGTHIHNDYVTGGLALARETGATYVVAAAEEVGFSRAAARNGACGLLAYVDRETRQVRKFEGNPEHPGSRGRNCAKGPATINQVTDPDRVLYPMRRAGRRGQGRWERVTWDEALDAIAARIRAAWRRDGTTRSWCTWAAPARTATPSGSWPAGASTGTTPTPTCAPSAAGPDSSSGWAWTGPAPTTPTRRSST
ncbi:MAG: molybdopterin-dependent oxidoreductase [Streptosporangiaceae bacterium]